jgi:glucosamine-6-phosphate deaminase
VRIRIFPTPIAVARALAADLARAIVTNPSLVLGLPTGRTSVPIYRELVARCRTGRVDVSRITTFNLDEFVGLAPDERTYGAFMARHLFDRLPLTPGRVHMLEPTGDLDAECRRYERAIRRAGGIDLQILGLGANGHIGFNEPASSLAARTHRARLALATRRANAALFGGRLSRVPREALSMGMASILGARRIVLVAWGGGKAAAVRRMVEGPITTRAPASFLQLHPRAEAWLDRQAARTLRGR